MNAQTKMEPASIVGVLAQALPCLGAVLKNKKNPAFRSSYADLNSVLQALVPITDHGLWFRQEGRPSEKGVALETYYIHESGVELSAGITEVPVNKTDAQAYGSAQSYCRRYALMTAFGLSAEDDDGNAAAKSPPPARQAARSELRDQLEQSVEQEKPKREKLAGPHTSPTALRTAIKEFVHTMRGCGDWDEWLAYRDTKEVRELVGQIQRDMPEWWDGGPSMPEEFVPLHRQIEMFEATMAQQIVDIARA